MTDKFNIDDDKLDDFLRKHYLLNEDAEADEIAAGLVLNNEYDVTINKEKESDLLRKLSGNKGGKRGYCIFYTGAIFFIIFMGFVYLHGCFKQNKTDSKQENATQPGYVTPKDETINNSEEEKDTATNNAPGFISTPLKNFYTQIPSALETLAVKPDIVPPIISDPPEWHPPALTEAQARQTESLKLVMIKYIFDLNKTLYTKVKSGKVYFKGGSAKLESFAMRNFEITNIEYKVFLNDLILKGRYEDYLVAKVNTDLWERHNISGYSESYFEQAEYGYFPIVNISTRGAEMFCKWLQEEANLYAGTLGSKGKKISVRLPYDIEWVYFYDYGYVLVPMCDGFNSIFDKEEGLVLQDNLDDPDLYGDEPVELNREKFTQEELKKKFRNKYGLSETDLKDIYDTGLNKIKSSFDTQKILDPLLMSTACNYGDVPEMIYEKKTGNFILMGQCWKDKEEYLRMNKEFISQSGSPYVGFRPLIFITKK